MTDTVLPDPESPVGKRVAERLDGEQVIWLTTVGADRTPQPNPVWFIKEDEGLLVYNRADAHRLKHIRHPHYPAGTRTAAPTHCVAGHRCRRSL